MLRNWRVVKLSTEKITKKITQTEDTFHYKAKKVSFSMQKLLPKNFKNFIGQMNNHHCYYDPILKQCKRFIIDSVRKLRTSKLHTTHFKIIYYKGARS